MPQKTNNFKDAFVQNQNDSKTLAPYFSAFKTGFCETFFEQLFVEDTAAF